MYVTNKVNDRLIIIGEQAHPDFVNAMQLVIGDERAALIDTGDGVSKDLDAFARRFTALPITVLLTHGHHDHAGNADLFGDIYMSGLDAGLLNADAPFPYKNIDDGDIFDLGGVQLEACALPGHTPGSFCFLDRRGRYALTGDAVNQCTWLWWDDCLRAGAYAEQIERFAAKLAERGITDLYHGHAMDRLPGGICADMAAACREIARGETGGDARYAFEFPVEKADAVYQHTYGDALIVYDRNMQGIF